MKKFLSSMLPLLMAILCWGTASAQWSTTVKWDEPGSIQILTGTTSASSSTPMDLPASATSVTLTEAKAYFIAPADGYAITSVTLDGEPQTLGTLSYTNPTKIYSITANWASKAETWNGKTIEVTTEKLTYENFTLDVANGASSISFLLTGGNGTTLGREITPADGKNDIKYSTAETTLRIQSAGLPRADLYSVTLNGQPVEMSNALQKVYEVPLTPGCQVYVAKEDPSLYQSCKVTFSFTNGDPNCLNNIRDWAAGKFIMPAELTPDYVLDIAKGGEIQFNFNEDYTDISVTANGSAVANPGGRKIAINEDTNFVITATGVTYNDVEALIYTNDIESLTLTTDLIDGKPINYEFVKDVPAGSVTLNCGYTIPIDTKLYKATNVPGKTQKFFFEVANGYWLKKGILGNYNDPEDPQGYMLNGTTMVKAADAPVFLNVQKIDYSQTAYVYYEGPNNCGKISCKSPDGTFATFKGNEYLANGWNTINYDPEYNSAFTAGLYVDANTVDYSKTVVLNDRTLTADDNGVYNFTFTNNSVMKMFLTANPVSTFTVNITSEGYAPATVVYDMAKTITEFPASAKVYGTTDFIVTPGVNVKASVNGTAAPFADGKYTATMKAAGTITLAQNMANATAAGKLIPADNSKVRKLAKVTLELPFDGEHAFDFAADAAKYITLTSATARAAAINPESVEAGDPSDTAIPVVMTFPVQEAAGAYTLNIPAGLIWQTGWNDAAESFLPTGIVNAPISATYTVDPAMAYEWNFTPENGSTNAFTGDSQVIVMSLPDAESLSSDAFTDATGPWVKFNGINIKKVDDADAEEGWSYIENMATYGKPAVAILVSKSIMSKIGTLEITAEPGALTVDGNEASPAINYSAQFGEMKSYTVEFDPASGTEVDSFNEIKLTFKEAETVAINEGSVYVQFRTGMSWGIELNESRISVEGNTVTFNVSTDATLIPGRYIMTIGEGTFLLDGNQLSDEIGASWDLIRNSEVDQTWQPTPAEGVINNGWGMDVAFVFGDIETVSYGENIDDMKVVFNGAELPKYSGNDDVEYYRYALEPYMPNVIMISAYGGKLMDKATEGTLTVTIPAGGIKISGEPNKEEISYTWRLVAEKDYIVVLSPEDGQAVKQLDKVTIEFPNAEKAQLTDYFQTSWVNVYKGYSVYTRAASVEMVDGAAHPTFVVTLEEPVTENGTYEIKIYSGAFLLDGIQESNQIEATYTVDDTLVGIDGIYSDNGLYTVVSLQGIVVLSDAPADKVKALPAGFYIINGKKVNLR